jgi:hypothetical protein
MSRKYHARAPETNSLKSALVQTVGINATKRSGTLRGFGDLEHVPKKLLEFFDI